MKRSPIHSLTAALLILSSLLCQAQPAPLSAHAAKIKARVAQLAPADKITVIMLQGPSYHGAFRSAEDTTFSLEDVDEKRLVTLRYEEVKKVQNGYGGYNSVTRRHVNPVRNRVLGVLILAALIVIVAVAVSNDK
jgi:hypothetical protein